MQNSAILFFYFSEKRLINVILFNIVTGNKIICCLQDLLGFHCFAKRNFPGNIFVVMIN